MTKKYGPSALEVIDHARADIRNKLEESWFGKAVTPDHRWEPSSSLDKHFGGPKSEAPEHGDGELRQSPLDDLYGGPSPEAPENDLNHEQGRDIGD